MSKQQRENLGELYRNRIHWVAGRPRVAGTWLPVATLSWLMEEEGISPASLLADFQELTAVDLMAALAWARDHRDAIVQEQELMQPCPAA